MGQTRYTWNTKTLTLDAASIALASEEYAEAKRAAADIDDARAAYNESERAERETRDALDAFYRDDASYELSERDFSARHAELRAAWEHASETFCASAERFNRAKSGARAVREMEYDFDIAQRACADVSSIAH